MPYLIDMSFVLPLKALSRKDDFFFHLAETSKEIWESSSQNDMKSINLQYNSTLVCWFTGTNDLLTKRLMFQVLFFFIKSCKIVCKNPFHLFLYFKKKITKLKIKSFECPKSIRNHKKIMLGTSDAWSTSRLSHRPSEPAYYTLIEILWPITYKY